MTARGYARLASAALASGAAQLGLGLVGVVAAAADPAIAARAPIPVWHYAAQIAAWGGAAGVLLLNRGRDPRARWLALALLAIGASYAWRPARLLADAFPGFEAWGHAVWALPVDAFLPLAMWSFALEFPRALGTAAGARRARRVLGATALLGSLLWLASASSTAALLGTGASLLPTALVPLDRSREGGLYWLAVYGGTLPALPLIAWRARRAHSDERKRARLFIWGLLLAATPMALLVPASVLIASFAELLRSPTGASIVRPLANAIIVSIPLTTSYAVLVQRALDVRIVVRQWVQYLLARTTVSLTAAAPFVAVGGYLYALRGEPLADLVAGWRPLAIGVGIGAGLVGVRLRRRATAAIDRLFFREQHDARELLAGLVERARGARTARELGALLCQEIDRALHLDGVTCFAVDDEGSALRPVTAGSRALALSSPIARHLARHEQPLAVDVERPAEWLRSLPNEEREWLVDGGFRMLVPLAGSDRSLIGLLALGAKRSELAFSREDLLLLGAVSAAGGLTLETRAARRLEDAGEERLARACSDCGRIEPAGAVNCTRCARELVGADFPQLLLGKFRFEERIGAGGMGVVYRATDVALQRPVALKTLPKTSPEGAMRLRREARAMAAVQHANLALIYGAETWRGTPLLVVELLEGGTLAERLRRGPLGSRDTAELGIVLARVLERVHAAGVLHRDLKPSNVGYTRDGTPKLLDFGLAQIVHEVRHGPLHGGDPRLSVAARGSVALPDGDPAASVVTDGIVGTPLYMSPEALWNQPPEVGFDLWSAAVVLFEALTGRHPFQRDTWPETVDAIVRGRWDESPRMRAAVPDSWAEFFRESLHRDRDRRPADAAAFRRRLETTPRSDSQPS